MFDINLFYYYFIKREKTFELRKIIYLDNTNLFCLILIIIAGHNIFSSNIFQRQQKKKDLCARMFIDINNINRILRQNICVI